MPAYKNGIFDFVDYCRKLLKIHSAIDDPNPVEVWFDIDTKGHITNVDVKGDVDAELKDRLKTEVAQRKDWSAGKFFGVERSYKMMILLTNNHETNFLRTRFLD